MNANRIVIGALIVLCCLVGCSDPDEAIQQLEKENEALKQRSQRLSEEQMHELRTRLDKIESIDKEAIPITDEFEAWRNAFEDEEARILAQAREVSELLKEIKDGQVCNLESLPDLIQALKDEHEAALEENEKLKKEIVDLKAAQH